MQPMELVEDGLSSAEKRAFRDAAELIGTKKSSYHEPFQLPFRYRI